MKRSIRDIIHSVVVYILVFILKVTIGIYMKFKYNVHMVKSDGLKLKGGYFILANHTNNMDPIFIQYFCNRPVYFVVNDTAWKNRFLRVVLNYVELIPIKKNTTDTVAARAIISAIKQGRVVGIFPEGKRSWGGVTHDMVSSTASLIKKLKVPLVTIKMSGAMMSRPRWSYQSRRGKVVLQPKIALDADMISNMSVSEINDIINLELYNDEHEFLKNNPDIIFKSKKFAQCLELYLFACKHCGGICSTKSCGNRFYCTNCGKTYSFENDCSLKDEDQNTITLLEWDEYQIKLIQNIMQTCDKYHVLFLDEDVVFYEYEDFKPLKFIAKGSLKMTSETMVFTHERHVVFDVDKVRGVNIQRNNQVEFSYQHKRYRFIFGKGISAYKWQIVLTAK